MEMSPYGTGVEETSRTANWLPFADFWRIGGTIWGRSGFSMVCCVTVQYARKRKWGDEWEREEKVRGRGGGRERGLAQTQWRRRRQRHNQINNHTFRGWESESMRVCMRERERTRERARARVRFVLMLACVSRIYAYVSIVYDIKTDANAGMCFDNINRILR